MNYLYPLWLILCISVGGLLGYMTGYGTFRGMTDGMFVAVLPLFLFMIGLMLMSLWRPILPACRCGKCPSKRFRYVRPTKDDQPGIRFQCSACGRIYVSSQGRFDEVSADGQMIPYLRHSRWGRWKQRSDHFPS